MHFLRLRSPCHSRPMPGVRDGSIPTFRTTIRRHSEVIPAGRAQPKPAAATGDDNPAESNTDPSQRRDGENREIINMRHPQIDAPPNRPIVRGPRNAGKSSTSPCISTRPFEVAIEKLPAITVTPARWLLIYIPVDGT